MAICTPNWALSHSVIWNMEKDIRENPPARTAALLKRVFGN